MVFINLVAKNVFFGTRSYQQVRCSSQPTGANIKINGCIAFKILIFGHVGNALVTGQNSNV